MCTLAINTLASLPLSARGDQGQVRDWLHVLVCAAASRLSIHHACRDLDGAPSNATVLGDLATPLRDLAQLADTRPTLWVRLGPKSLRQRGRRDAIDLLAWPSHRTVDEGHQDAVRRGQATHGTPHFFPSATASVILRGRRYTLALYRVRASLTMEQVVERLQQRLDTLAIQVSVLWLARGFYSGKVLRALMERQQPCIRPAVTRGKEPPQPGGPTGTSAMAQWTCRAWTS